MLSMWCGVDGRGWAVLVWCGCAVFEEVSSGCVVYVEGEGFGDAEA